MTATFLERYQAGERVPVWDELMALGEGVRAEPYLADAEAVAAETMRRARHNVELLIRRLADMGYRFRDAVSSAEDRLARIDVLGQLSSQMETFAAQRSGQVNTHTLKMLESVRALKTKMAPLLEKSVAEAARQAAADRKPPLEDPQVFNPPDKKTARNLTKLEKIAGGPLPLSLRAWYEQVGGVSLIGSHEVLNAVSFSNRGILSRFASLQSGGVPEPPVGADFAPDPLVIYPVEELLDQASNREDDDACGDEELELVLSPDDLHKANISGDAYYIALPDARADFQFDDWHKTTFVNYLRITFAWGGFPGWERYNNPPRKELAELSESLLPL